MYYIARNISSIKQQQHCLFLQIPHFILEVAQELEVEILDMETDKDRIHILAEADPSFG